MKLTYSLSGPITHTIEILTNESEKEFFEKMKKHIYRFNWDRSKDIIVDMNDEMVGFVTDIDIENLRVDIND